MKDEFATIGQSIRPVLVILPPGLLIMALIFDITRYISGLIFFADVGFWNLIAGVVAAGVGALATFVDLVILEAWPGRQRLDPDRRRVARTSGMVHAWSLALLALVWLARSGRPHHTTNGALFTIELVAFIGVGAAAAMGRLPAGWLHAAWRWRPARPHPDVEETVDIASLLRPTP